MSTSLRQRLSELASSFAWSVLDAIRGASVEDLAGESSPRGRAPSRDADAASEGGRGRRRAARLPRRSADDIAAVVDQIIALVKQNAKGLRAEEIREKLGLEAKELPRPLKEALDSGRLGKSGQKRATTYFAKGAGRSSGASSKGGRAKKRAAPARRKKARPATPKKRARSAERAAAAAPAAGGASSAES